MEGAFTLWRLLAHRMLCAAGFQETLFRRREAGKVLYRRAKAVGL
jgi:hypothetical protein